MKNLLQYAFIVNMFLNLTNLCAFIPVWLGLSLTIVGGLMLIVNLLYLISESALVMDLFKSGMMWALLILILVWPIIAAAYPIFSGYSLRREIILQVFYFTSLLGSVVLTLKIGYERLRTLIYFSFVVSLLGMGFQAFLAEAFNAVAVLSDDSGEVFAYGRIAGFFINPNVAGRFILLFYLMLMMSSKKLSVFEVLILIVVTFGAVMLTASRSSLVIAFIAFLYVIAQRFGAPYIRGRMSINPIKILLSFVSIVVLVGASVFALIAASDFILQETSVGANKNVAKRFELFTGGVDGFLYVIEQETLGRWYTVEPYLDGFKESWLFGRGLAGYRVYMNENYIGLAPHNTLFAAWLDFGVLYVIAGFICFGYVALSRRIRIAEGHLGLFFMPIIFIVCMGIMFTYDAFLYQRGLYVMIGGIIALYFAPKDWFQFNAFVGQQPLIRRRRKKNSRNLAV